MGDVSPQTEPGRRFVAGVITLSCAVAALGVLSLWIAIRQEMPVPFGLVAGATLIFVAIWNVATLHRHSEYPEGRWLTAASVRMIITGLAGALSSLWPLGLFLRPGVSWA